MTAISSFKPFSASPEVAANQLAAKQTWESVFSQIVYFSPEIEPALASPKTRFVPSPDWPRIRDMMQYATDQPEWSCLINADIQVSFRLRFVEMELMRLGAQSAISFRHELPGGKVVDNGLDWFAAEPGLWALLAKRVPPDFRMGHILWDTWTLSAFTAIGRRKQCFDVTATKCIFHPKHGDRCRPHTIVVNDPLLRVIHQPGRRLGPLGQTARDLVPGQQSTG